MERELRIGRFTEKKVKRKCTICTQDSNVWHTCLTYWATGALTLYILQLFWWETWNRDIRTLMETKSTIGFNNDLTHISSFWERHLKVNNKGICTKQKQDHGVAGTQDWLHRTFWGHYINSVNTADGPVFFTTIMLSHVPPQRLVLQVQHLL